MGLAYRTASRGRLPLSGQNEITLSAVEASPEETATQVAPPRDAPSLGNDQQGADMRTPKSVRSAEDFGRVRLSQTFFMRDFLYSEIANVHRMTNLPDDPDLAIEAGKALCVNLLEPLQATFGRLAVRSAYRSAEVNAFGNKHSKNCASNDADRARHIWDQKSADGGIGAMATIVVPWLVDRLEAGATWQAMAWWIHDHLPYSELQFFPKLAAFNISWHERPRRRITSFASPRGLLTKPGLPNHDGDHSMFYEGFPALAKPTAWTPSPARSRRYEGAAR
jgi:hypothetical protein